MLHLSRTLNIHDVHLAILRRLPVIPSYAYSTFTIPPDPQPLSSIEIARKKYPTRGGQNLSLRFRRLEKSLRGKEGYDQRIAELKEDTGVAIASTSHPVKKDTFMGFAIPQKPEPPADDECCMSGCAVCVYDLYEEAMTDYNDKISSLRTSLQVLRIPEDDWPACLRPTRGKAKPQKSVTLSAFEELEQHLRQKQESLHSPTGASPPLTASIPSANDYRPNRDPSLYGTSAVRSPRHVASTEHTVQAPAPVPSRGLEEHTLQLARKRRRRKTSIPDAASVYEGLRWVLFSNR